MKEDEILARLHAGCQKRLQVLRDIRLGSDPIELTVLHAVKALLPTDKAFVQECIVLYERARELGEVTPEIVRRVQWLLGHEEAMLRHARLEAEHLAQLGA